MSTSTAITIEKLGSDLKGLLSRLRLGETITLVTPDGAPVAILISLKPAPALPPAPDWLLKWETLAEEISRAWKSDKSAIETLTEMRR
jgi:antitoxin (DNA-binding transcriptional repressor) of toxin-antitoxin stability system